MMSNKDMIVPKDSVGGVSGRQRLVHSEEQQCPSAVGGVSGRQKESAGGGGEEAKSGTTDLSTNT